MILLHRSSMPYLVSGMDDQGRPWTALRLPKEFAERLNRQTPKQRAATWRGLLADFKRSV